METFEARLREVFPDGAIDTDEDKIAKGRAHIQRLNTFYDSCSLYLALRHIYQWQPTVAEQLLSAMHSLRPLEHPIHPSREVEYDALSKDLRQFILQLGWQVKQR